MTKKKDYEYHDLTDPEQARKELTGMIIRLAQALDKLRRQFEAEEEYEICDEILGYQKAVSDELLGYESGGLYRACQDFGELVSVESKDGYYMAIYHVKLTGEYYHFSLDKELYDELEIKLINQQQSDNEN